MEEQDIQYVYKAIVKGKVQGVGFRYFTSKQAKRFNVLGHAKNLQDGSVEVLMLAKKASLLSLIQWLENGPETAIVESFEGEFIDVTEIGDEKPSGFSCL
ncbi:acylphosphatase [Psychromonas sp. psych-6C06]|uniref:acylphosphatase n=1 Tax=Psychromonas sp. psych-6C06 TaxID=2058089 RepID=UPI000C32FF48|nr:acylphosphatase [Psychromonas sp. psych-6C06]PKF60691.1 acylphosphatase [Psychromonas sp. psych-6C06]